MPAWEPAGDGRWVRDTDDRHLLLQAGRRLVEMHGTTIHVYDGPERPDPANPLGEATWVETEERPKLAGSPVDVLWEMLADQHFTQPATSEVSA